MSVNVIKDQIQHYNFIFNSREYGKVKFKRCTASKLCQGEDMHAVPTLSKTKAPLLPKPKPA